MSQKTKRNLSSTSFFIVKDLLETFEKINLIEEYDIDFFSSNVDVEPVEWYISYESIERDRKHKEQSMPWLKNNNRKQRYTGRK